MPKRKTDIPIGQKINNWTVIGSAFSVNRHLYYPCQCTCGRIVNVRKFDLMANKIKSCHSCAIREANMKQAQKIVGQTINGWTVLDFIGIENHKAKYQCQCPYGIIKDVTRTALTAGVSELCKKCTGECKFFNPQDIVGQRFGKWTVLECLGHLEDRPRKPLCYKCRCDCGRESIVLRNSLIRGLSKSCGLCNKLPAPCISAENDHYRYHCSNGDSFIFSPCDLALAEAYDWHMKDGYAFCSEDGRLLTFARIALNAKDDEFVDHVSMITRDERRENLRICSWSDNNCNKILQSNNTSGFKGVSFHKASGKYIASLWKDNAHYYGGLHDDPVQAALAYDELARKHHGEFARLNFPIEGERSCMSKTLQINEAVNQ